MLERNNTNMTLDRIFEEIFNMISEASRIPLTDKIIIEENDLVGALDDLKDAIPKEVSNASHVLEEQKNIVNKAYEEADKIVQQAKDEAERIIGRATAEADTKIQEEEIVKQAAIVAEDLKADALHYQEEIKREADDYAIRVKHDSLQYADDMLAYLANNLQSALQGLTDNRGSINEERDNLQSQINSLLPDSDELSDDEE